MVYFLLILFTVFSVFAIERTVDVFVAIRRGYFKPAFGGCVLLESLLLSPVKD